MCGSAQTFCFILVVCMYIFRHQHHAVLFLTSICPFAQTHAFRKSFPVSTSVYITEAQFLSLCELLWVQGSLHTSLWDVRCYELPPFMQMCLLLPGPEVTLSHWQPWLPTLQVICWVCQALQNHVNAIIIFVIIIIIWSISCFPSFIYCLKQMM